LVKSGADVNAVSNRQFTPLAFATAGQHFEIVKFLLSLPDVDPNVINADHQCALSIAITGNAGRITRLLLADSRVTVNDFLGPVFYAAKFNRLSVFKKITSRPDFDWTMRGPHNETLLHLFVMDARFKIFQEVIGRKEIDINAVDETGETALSRACAMGSVQIIRGLLQREGIDVNHANRLGWTALHYACNCGVPEAAIPLIMHQDMDINARTRGGLAPLHMIVKGGLVDALKAICWRTDLDVNQFTRAKKPLNALMICAYSNRPELMRILLNYPGIDLQLRSSSGHTAHSIAVGHGYVECAQLTARVETEAIVDVKPKKRATLFPRRSARLVL
jgi:ankyrin repeat protein